MAALADTYIPSCSSCGNCKLILMPREYPSIVILSEYRCLWMYCQECGTKVQLFNVIWRKQ